MNGPKNRLCCLFIFEEKRFICHVKKKKKISIFLGPYLTENFGENLTKSFELKTKQKQENLWTKNGLIVIE